MTDNEVDAFTEILEEIKYQNQKWGENKPQSLAGFLLILEAELNEAKEGWMKNIHGRDSCLSEIKQVAATAIQCLIRYGTSGCAISTNDIRQ